MCLIWNMILKGQLYLSSVWLGVDLRMAPNRRVLKRDWIACLKFVNHSRCNSEHDWGGGPICHQ